MSARPHVLVTGASGRVGSAVATRLSTRYNVIGLDLLPGPHTSHLGSVEDARLVGRAVQGAVAVVHTASLHAPDVGRQSDARFRSVNVEGTRTVLDAALRQGVRRFVYTSTTSIYGHALEAVDQAVWVTEKLEPAPRDIYDETKLQAEALCRKAAAGPMSCVSLRISRCFPEPAHLMATYRLYRGVDLRDVGQAHELALDYVGQQFQTFNISAQSPFRREDCPDLLAGASRVMARRVPGVERIYEKRSWPLPQSIDRIYVIDKATELLDYRPHWNFNEWLAEVD
jgi:nucleoside-diphosphate-sugar epimerase